MIGQQTGSDERYLSDGIKALYRSTDVEKRTILIQSDYHDLIKVYILGISSDNKECFLLCFISQPYIFCIASVRFFMDTELHTGDCNGVDETSVSDVTRKIPYWLSHRFCGGGKTEEGN